MGVRSRRSQALLLAPMMGWRKEVLAAVLAAIFAATCGCFRAVTQEQQKPAPACGGEAIARGTVSRVSDGRTFVFDDGREVRLAAIEVPPLPQETGAAPGGGAATAGLAALAGGDEVVLRRAENPSDRYGRVVAYAYAMRDGDEIFVQGELISAGLAQVGDRVGKPDLRRGTPRSRECRPQGQAWPLDRSVL